MDFRTNLERSIALIGFTSVLLAASGIMPASGGEKVLFAFGGSDGALPAGALIAGKHGSMYGATESGGSSTRCSEGCGTIFEIAGDGREKVLYYFQGKSDGEGPSGSLFLDGSGNLYGTAAGGAGTNCSGIGCGVVFKLAPDKTESVLYTFQGGSDGLRPNGSLVADTSGDLYGLTIVGGNFNGSECEQAGCGTIFEVQPNGTKIPLYTFEGGGDGAYPSGGLVADGSGNFYGTTENGGGAACGGDGCGTVFKLTPNGTESVETVLYSFQGGTDGEVPMDGLIMDSAGNLYGTTARGGSIGAGTVFKVTPQGTETVLYSFKEGKDGGHPEAGLVMDGKGNLYGTTYYGGSHGCKKTGDGCGTVFKLTPDGQESKLYTFRDFHQADDRGVFPQASLLMGKKGLLYGTTTAGGVGNDGVVFSVKK